MVRSSGGCKVDRGDISTRKTGVYGKQVKGANRCGDINTGYTIASFKSDWENA